MHVLLAILSGILFAAGVWLILRRSLARLVLGLILLSQAANLVIFTSGGLHRAAPPIVGENATALEAPYADPLPQALILTAIVISFGLFAFFLVLIKRAHQETGTDDIDAMSEVET
ncbi:MAG: Na+/H+ antiporter subunit C [Bacteroidetes bacterium]|nr:Na+/H+ antiporter subunit C [Bacteroidota bacterium]